jgi:GntR family transcriptional regulator, rspAB operon transcriptional repressor
MAMEPEKIYQMLKERIMWLELAPESVMNISELAQDFSVSRTPIKEAMLLLQAEGWILRQKNHFSVTPLSLDRIREITEIRLVMEVQANIWAMYRITKQELKSLKALEKEILQINEAPSKRRVVEIDLKFHRKLFEATKNHQLAQSLDRLLCHFLRFWLSIPREYEPTPSPANSLEVIQAIEEKDEARLRAASFNHIKWSMDEMLRTYL